MTNKKRKKSQGRNILIIILILLICTIGTIFAVVYSRIKKTVESSLVYDYIYVNDDLVSGMTKEELKTFLVENYQQEMENLSFTINIKDKNIIKSMKDFDVKFDIDKTVDTIYSLGRKESLLESYAAINELKENPEKISFSYIYNEEKVHQFVQELYDTYLVEKVDSFYKIDFDSMQLTLTSGHHGESFDKENLTNQIIQIAENATSNQVIEVEIINDNINTIDGKTIYDQIYIKERDAYGDVIGKELKVIEHKVGREIDKDLLKENVDNINSNEDTTITQEIYMVYPQITKEVYESRIFTSTLASHFTEFDTSTENNKSRAINIGLATKEIDGTILVPGATFSFNGVVGPRSEANGYQVAHVYQGGKVIDGVGGGICQVSSTLYNACLMADLEIKERRNHMFIVSYVKLGTDATVSYGSQDYKFVNNTNWPIKITGYVDEEKNQVHFSIVGTNENPGQVIKLESKIIEKLPFEIVYEDDDTLSEGQKVVDHYGMTGYVAEAFKVYYQDGVYKKEESLGVNYYNPYDQIVRVGTN